MSRNIYCDARCVVDGKDIPHLKTASVTFAGDNKLNSINVTFGSPDLESYSLYNKKLEFYLNESSYESLPYFTGYIKDVSPTSSELKVKALDPRTFISGREARKINITDKDNYDGYTLVQFLQDIVRDDRLPLGGEYLKETSIPVLMKKIRGDKDPYSFIQQTIKKVVNDKDIENVKEFSVDIVESSEGPQLIIKEKKDINGNPSLRLSYMDGIQSLTYNKRAIPSYGIAKSGKFTGIFQDGNMPLGYRSVDVKGDFKDPDTAKYKALLEVYKGKDKSLDITVDANKGFKTPLGSVIYLDVDDFRIRGNHLLTQKRTNWSEGNVKLKLSLGRPAPVIGDFLQ